jgi:hypothetical protein
MRKLATAAALALAFTIGSAGTATAAPGSLHVNLNRTWAHKCKAPYTPTSYFDAIRTRNFCRYYTPRHNH